MTKVVVSSVGDSLDAQVSPVFGRCAYLLFVDTDTMALQTFANQPLACQSAGIRAASSRWTRAYKPCYLNVS